MDTFCGITHLVNQPGDKLRAFMLTWRIMPSGTGFNCAQWAPIGLSVQCDVDSNGELGNCYGLFVNELMDGMVKLGLNGLPDDISLDLAEDRLTIGKLFRATFNGNIRVLADKPTRNGFADDNYLSLIRSIFLRQDVIDAILLKFKVARFQITTYQLDCNNQTQLSYDDAVEQLVTLFASLFTIEKLTGEVAHSDGISLASIMLSRYIKHNQHWLTSELIHLLSRNDDSEIRVAFAKEVALWIWLMMFFESCNIGWGDLEINSPRYTDNQILYRIITNLTNKN